MSTISAYVLIDCGGGGAHITAIVSKVAQFEGVIQAHALFGPIDAIAYVQASDLAALEKVVLKMHDTPGVKNTDTRIARII